VPTLCRENSVAACRHSSRVDSPSGQFNGKNATVPKNSAVTSALFTRFGTRTKWHSPLGQRYEQIDIDNNYRARITTGPISDGR